MLLRLRFGIIVLLLSRLCIVIIVHEASSQRILLGSAIIGVPLLYSPLYQSIRLILFGALSLTGVTAINAQASIDIKTSQSVITPSKGIAKSKAAAVQPNTSQANLSLTAVKNEDNSGAANFDTNFESNVSSEIDNDMTSENITAINERDEDNAEPLLNTNNTANSTPDNKIATRQNIVDNVTPKLLSANDDNQTKRRKTRLAQGAASDPAIDNSRIDVSDQSIQESLTRLAEFYDLKPNKNGKIHN